MAAINGSSFLAVPSVTTSNLYRAAVPRVKVTEAGINALLRLPNGTSISECVLDFSDDHPQSGSSNRQLDDICRLITVKNLQITDLHLCLPDNTNIDKFLSAIAPYNTALRSLSLSLNTYQLIKGLIMDDLIPVITTHYQHLQELNLPSAWTLTDSHLKALVRACSRLQELDLSDCNKLTGASISEIATSCPYLQKLRIRGISTSRMAVVQIAKSCRRLTHLDLSYLDCLDNPLIYTIMPYCPQLEQLDVSCYPSCDEHLHPGPLDDQSVEHIARSCQKLSELRLANQSKVTDKAILEVATHCRSLEVLCLKGCQVTDTLLSRVKFPSLRSFEANGCPNLTEEGIQQFLQNHPRLTRLLFSTNRLEFADSIRKQFPHVEILNCY